MSTILILLVISTFAMTESAVLLSQDQLKGPEDTSDRSQPSATQNEDYITKLNVERDASWYLRYILIGSLFG